MRGQKFARWREWFLVVVLILLTVAIWHDGRSVHETIVYVTAPTTTTTMKGVQYRCVGVGGFIVTTDQAHAIGKCIKIP